MRQEPTVRAPSCEVGGRRGEQRPLRWGGGGSVREQHLRRQRPKRAPLGRHPLSLLWSPQPLRGAE